MDAVARSTFRAVSGHRVEGAYQTELSRGMTRLTDEDDGVLRSELMTHQDFGNRYPAFSGDGIEQIHPPVFFEYGRIPQLIYLPVGGAAH
jgi:hypothetical protein